MVTGKAVGSEPSPIGVSTLYTLDVSSGTMVKRGAVDRVCSGNKYSSIGFPGQGPGKVARVVTWNRVLGIEDIQLVANALITCKKDDRK